MIMKNEKNVYAPAGAPPGRWALGLALIAGLLSGCPQDQGPEPEPEAEDAGDPDPVDAGEGGFCPSEILFSSLTDGIAHVGWSGFTHNVGPADGAYFWAEVVACDDDCRNCRFEGPINRGAVNLLRCESDSSVQCEVDGDGTPTTVCPNYKCLPHLGGPGVDLCMNNFAPCGSDADCTPGQCKIFWGGNSASNIAVSSYGLVFGAPDENPPVQGTIDLFNGTVTFQRLGFQITSSTDRIPGFPPVCLGDTVRGDGVKDGVCSPSPYNEGTPGTGLPGGVTWTQHLDEPCDAHSGSGLPNRAGIYSLDCGVHFSTTVGFDMSSNGNGTAVQAIWSLDEDEQPLCPLPGGQFEPCWCGVCEGTAQPCHSHDDCIGTLCTADVIPPAQIPQNNACVTPCVWDTDTFAGSCQRPVGLTPDGGVILAEFGCMPRGTDAEVIARGFSERLSDRSFSIQTGVLGCAAPGGNPVTNSQLGLPGPNVGLYRFRVDLQE